MHSVPINPSDKNMLSGIYGKLPSQPSAGVGFEGAGEIVEVGPDAQPSLLNKKVAVFDMFGMKGYQGTWRQYLTSNANSLVVYPDHANYDQMASTFVNPMTVCYFYHIIKMGNHKTVIQDAACSSLGKMFIKLARAQKFCIINIVRRQEQVETLKTLKAKRILNSSETEFIEDLEVAIEESMPTAYFD